MLLLKTIPILNQDNVCIKFTNWDSFDLLFNNKKLIEIIHNIFFNYIG